MKKYWKILTLTAIVIILPVIAGLILWNKLPSEIPTHFGSDGAVDDYSSKIFAVIGLPLIMLGLHCLCFFAALADPKKSGYGKGMLTIILWICPIVSLLCGFVMYSAALGYNFNVGFIMSLFMGIVFVIIGNYMPKCKRNYTIGIRLPWTMNSDENWSKTHRLAGFIWAIGGVAIIATSFFAKVWVFFPIILLMTLIPAVYSYVYYVRNEKNK